MSRIIEGAVFEISRGGDVIVLTKPVNRKVTVQHNDDKAYVCTVSTENLLTGNIKNPYRPNVFGAGYFGVGPYTGAKGKVRYFSYDLWYRLLRRCYVRDKTLSMWHEWLDFQVFTKWYLDELELLDDAPFLITDYLNEEGQFLPRVMVEPHLIHFFKNIMTDTIENQSTAISMVYDGIKFGYPSCCVSNFIDDLVKNRAIYRRVRKLDGTGFLPCVTCDVRYSEDELVDIINAKRSSDLDPFTK